MPISGEEKRASISSAESRVDARWKSEKRKYERDREEYLRNVVSSGSFSESIS